MSAFKWGNQLKGSVLLKFTTAGHRISPGLREVRSLQRHVTKYIDILRHNILFYNLTATKLDKKCSAFHRVQVITTVQIKFENSWVQILASTCRSDRQMKVFFRHIRKIVDSDYSLVISIRLYGCMSVCMEQLSSYRKDLYKISYFSIFRISVENVQDSLISDKNNGHFTLRPLYTYDRLAQFFLE